MFYSYLEVIGVQVLSRTKTTNYSKIKMGQEVDEPIYSPDLLNHFIPQIPALLRHHRLMN